MEWGKWLDKLLMDLALVGIPVLVAALSALTDQEGAPVWASMAAAGGLIALRRLSNWVKHRADPDPAG